MAPVPAQPYQPHPTPPHPGRDLFGPLLAELLSPLTQNGTLPSSSSALPTRAELFESSRIESSQSAQDSPRGRTAIRTAKTSA